ncbi:photosynthetic reaction center subunit H [Roseobacter denitrificans]|uniref:Photosynthetic reaction center H subunit n=2 Tax=Roseobacter denitrificans TaxID=2434 RepID=Q16DS5_ROSDO|nr:photosynthetic reaction center subunit H [Roseobacter denitrificans]ABG29868.1 photosynthetic reaction center H subunit [Roseobacter denitrificans OCh 114]AVL53084.1 photosynthetic reaction center subunit H [Roseobacter denitrificans]CAB69084.1 reaction center H-subunit [Roseobacter denitrificans OCh 114]SFG25542.1 photosynthetic reaction center H subunit [Roseobacter denitrificans OCh 114]
MTAAFFGEFDLASLSLWLFYIFFAGLIIYIQRENMREGYPLEDDEGNPSSNPSMWPVPSDKTFKLPHGRGEVTVPSGQTPERADIALKRTGPGNGFPLEPTGDPMLDGVGPASWAPRRDAPELDGHGHPKIVPMSAAEGFIVSAGRDPRGLPVMSGDKEIVGKITDMWIDEPEQLVRFLEFELEGKWGSGTRLVPMTFANIKSNRVNIAALYGEHFANVPTIASPRQITLLEEDKIAGYYGGGKLYAGTRQEPKL